MNVAHVYVEGVVRAPGPSGDEVALEFLIDSGAQYSALPYDTWHLLGLTPKRSLTLVLADGSHIERGVAECYIRIPQGEGHTPVILGHPGDLPLLGVITLEEMGFVLDPFSRTIRPNQRAMLATIA